AVVARLPRPVRRGVVQAEQERLLLVGATGNEIDGALRQEIGEIALAMDLGVVLEKIVDAETVLVGVVVDAAGERPEMLVVAALERAEVRLEAEMPLADQRRAVALLAQPRGDRRMVGRQAHDLVATHGAADRLLGRAAQAVLVAAGRERETRRRADR